MAIQDKFSNGGKIYRITSSIDLGGTTLVIPELCVLDFQGGKIVNGTVYLNGTLIHPNGCVVTDYITAKIQGSYKKGQCLFDDTIGKPKWWNGEKWVDATGTDLT